MNLFIAELVCIELWLRLSQSRFCSAHHTPLVEKHAERRMVAPGALCLVFVRSLYIRGHTDQARAFTSTARLTQGTVPKLIFRSLSLCSRTNLHYRLPLFTCFSFTSDTAFFISHQHTLYFQKT